MYTVRYGDGWLHDPHSGTLLLSAQVSALVNEHGTATLVMAHDHPMAGEVSVRDPSRPVTVWDGDALLFSGFVWDRSTASNGDVTLSCKGELAWLSDTRVRPYSTVEGEAALIAPSNPAGLLQWYVDQHNSRVDASKQFRVGVNDGDLLDPNAHIYRASAQRPTTYDELMDKLIDKLGGVLSVRHEDGERWLDWHAECVSASSQVIDFGVNMTDYLRTDSAEGVVTALVPVGGTPEGEDGPVTLDSVPDGEVAPGVMLDGGTVWSVSGMELFGRVEDVHESDALTQEGLLASAIDALKGNLSTSITVEVDAVSLSLLSDEWEPLAPGQYVRVRSRPYGIDQYLLVSEMDLDCNNPEASRYTLGLPQGTYSDQLRRLNASINASADAVAAISDAAKAAAADADAAREAAEAAREAAGQAGGEVPIVALASTNGTVFKRNLGISTTIVATVYTPGGSISTPSDLADRLGPGAYLEWGWRDVATDAPHVIVSDDPRVSMGGFALTVGPDDVDVQATITCSLNC